MNKAMEALERFLELGGIKKDITLLVISGAAVVGSLLQWRPFPFDLAWASSPRSASGRTSPPARWPSSCSWADCWRS